MQQVNQARLQAQSWTACTQSASWQVLTSAFICSLPRTWPTFSLTTPVAHLASPLICNRSNRVSSDSKQQAADALWQRNLLILAAEFANGHSGAPHDVYRQAGALAAGQSGVLLPAVHESIQPDRPSFDAMCSPGMLITQLRNHLAPQQGGAPRGKPPSLRDPRSPAPAC